MKAAFGVFVALLLLGTSPAMAATAHASAQHHANALAAPASPSPSPTTESPTASPSPGAEGNQGGISTGAGLVIAAILVGGLLLMRNRLLRR